MADFFVSYNQADAGWAQWIAWQIEEAGYAVVLQAWDFLPGQDYSLRMDQTMQSVKRLIAVVSPDWQTAPHAQAELRSYYRRDPGGGQSSIVPMVVRPCEVKAGLYDGYIQTDLSRVTDEQMARRKLLDAVRAVQPEPARATAAPEHSRLKPKQAPPFPGVPAAPPRAAVDYSHLKKRKLPLQGVEDELFSIAFSDNGEWLAAGSKGTALLWNLRRGEGPTRTGGHGSYVYSVSFSHDSQRLATGGEDGFVRVWSVAPLKLLWKDQRHDEAVYSVAFSRDGRRVASGGYDGKLFLWDAARGQALRPAGSAVDGAGRVTSVAFSPDDRLLAFGTLKDNVWLLDIDKGEARILGSHESSVEGVAFSPDGRFVASCGLDKAVCVWDVNETDKKKPKWRKREHEYVVRSVAYSPDGQTLASVGWDKRLNLWDAESGALRASLPFKTNDRNWHSDWIWSVAFSTKDMLLASSGSDSRIVLWQVAAGA